MTGQLVSPTIRVVLVANEGLRRDIVHAALQHEPDLTLVDEVCSWAALEAILGRAAVDIVIWALDGEDMPNACLSVFDRYTHLKVLSIRDDGRHNFMWELLPTLRALGQLSPQELVVVIRQEFAR